VACLRIFLRAFFLSFFFLFALIAESAILVSQISQLPN